MFGMGFSEIIVILVIALIFLGPEKLPDAAKSISKGIRDLRKQTRDLQHQIEADEHIGGAIRDLRGALRGEPEPPRPRTAIPPPGIQVPGEKPPEKLAGDTAAAAAVTPANGAGVAEEPGSGSGVTLPPTAGETAATSSTTEGLSELVKPATGTVAKGASDPHGNG
jgi:sec-independent protein translocase protein TatB